MSVFLETNRVLWDLHDRSALVRQQATFSVDYASPRISLWHSKHHTQHDMEEHCRRAGLELAGAKKCQDVKRMCLLRVGQVPKFLCLFPPFRTKGIVSIFSNIYVSSMGVIL